MTVRLTSAACSTTTYTIYENNLTHRYDPDTSELCDTLPYGG